MASKTQICNLALSRVRDTRITDITDGSSEALILLTLYDQVAEFVMSQGHWSSCVFRATLAQLTDSPTFDHNLVYAYQLPVSPKFLKVLSVNNSTNETTTYAIEDGKLWADDSTVSIRYLGVQEDTERYGPYLQKAIVGRLASEIAYAITGDLRLMQMLEKKAENELLEGLALDGQQGTKEYLLSSTIVDARYGQY